MPKHHTRNVTQFNVRFDLITWSRLVALSNDYGCTAENLVRERVREYVAIEVRRNGITDFSEHVHKYLRNKAKTRKPPAFNSQLFRDIDFCPRCHVAIEDAEPVVEVVPQHGTKLVPHDGTHAVPQHGTRGRGGRGDPVSAHSGTGAPGEGPIYFKKTRPGVRFFLYLTNAELDDLNRTLDTPDVSPPPARSGHIWKELPRGKSTSA